MNYNSRTKHLLDTPYSARAQTTTTMFRTKTLASDIRAAVNKDLHNHSLSCKIAEFLEKILPVSESYVERILQQLTRKSWYTKGRWAKMPTSNKAKEDEFYEPFIEIATAISDEATTAKMGGDGRVKGVWVDRHSKTPESTDEDAADIRPDCFYVSSSAAIQHAEQIIAQALDELNQPGVSTKNKKKAQSLIKETEKRQVKEVRFSEVIDSVKS